MMRGMYTYMYMYMYIVCLSSVFYQSAAILLLFYQYSKKTNGLASPEPSLEHKNLNAAVQRDIRSRSPRSAEVSDGHVMYIYGHTCTLCPWGTIHVMSSLVTRHTDQNDLRKQQSFCNPSH